MKKTVTRSDVALDAARFLVNSAVEFAEQHDFLVTAAVVDISGRLKAYLSMDGVTDISLRAAQDKAYSALLGLPTDDLGKALEATPLVRDSLLQASGMTLLPGGYPIYADEMIIGALGVGGGTTEQDEACATHALEALTRL